MLAPACPLAFSRVHMSLGERQNFKALAVIFLFLFIVFIVVAALFSIATDCLHMHLQ